MICPRCYSTLIYTDYDDRDICCVMCGQRTPLPAKPREELPFGPAPRRGRKPALELIVALLEKRGMLSTSEVATELRMSRDMAETRLWKLVHAKRITIREREKAPQVWEVAA